MPDKVMARRHPAQADRHIAATEQRLTVQRARAEALATGGHDEAALRAEGLAATLQQTLDVMHGHRELILREFATGGPAD
jgi:hypothetical protein